MANTRSAAKRARQTETRTLVNRRALTSVKNRLKEVRIALRGGKKDEATAAAQKFISAIDKAVKTGRIHKNSANRHKSAIGKALAGIA
jgi:small subunit ribosomal protein S20